MTQTRGKLYQTLNIPVPRKLANSSVSANALSIDFARDITNMLPSVNKAGVLAKRYGFDFLGTAVPSGNIERLYPFIKYDGTSQILATTDTGFIYLTEDDGATWTEIRNGLTVGSVVRATPYTDAGGNDYLVFYNGVEENVYWDGTNFRGMVDFVKEQRVVTGTASDTFTIESTTDISGRYVPTEQISFRINANNATVTSITTAGTTATVTTTAQHNLVNDDFIYINNAFPAEYNGRKQITVTGANTFTYEVEAGTATPAEVYKSGIKAVKGISKPISETKQVERIADATSEFSFGNDKVEHLKLTFRAYKEYQQIQNDIDVVDNRLNVRLLYKSDSTDWSTLDIFNLSSGSQTKWEQTVPDEPNLRFKFAGEADLNYVEVQNGEYTTITEFVGETGVAPTGENVIGVSTITRSGSTATVTTDKSHNLAVNDAVTIYDAKQKDYNGTFIVLTTPSTTSFTYSVPNDPETPALPATYLPSTISYTAENLKRDANVVTSTYNAGTLTVVVDTDVFPQGADGLDIKELEYRAVPKPFTFIHVFNDRMYALTNDFSVRQNYGREDSTRVYYSTATGSVSSWFSDVTQAEAYFDVGGKMRGEDFLTGISSIDNSLIVHGREQLQVWIGLSPDESFQWAKTVPLGTISPELIQSFPQDVMFFGDYGARSMRNVFQSEGLEATADLGSNIDPTAQRLTRHLLASDDNYRQARSFLYAVEGMYGFHFGDDTLIYTISEEARGWTRLNLFKQSLTTFAPRASNNTLLASNGNRLAIYKNGFDGQDPLFADFGNSVLFSWWTPWVDFNKRYSNIHWELEVEAESRGVIQLQRYKDWDEVNYQTKEFNIDTRFFAWDEDDWDEDPWDGNSGVPRTRDKFLANSVAVKILGNNTTGKFEIVGIKGRGSK